MEENDLNRQKKMGMSKQTGSTYYQEGIFIITRTAKMLNLHKVYTILLALTLPPNDLEAMAFWPL